MIPLYTSITLTILTVAFIYTPLTAQQIKEHHFNFRGFGVIIKDCASDEMGNHVFVGRLCIVEKEANKRDTMINRIFDFQEHIYDKYMGIAILTDKDYNIIKVAKTFLGERVVYQPEKKQFIIGANFYTYLSNLGQRSFSAWQPVIVRLNLELQGYTYFIEQPYSCFLKDMIVNGDDILVLAIKDDDGRRDSNRVEQGEIIRVQTDIHRIDSGTFSVRHVLNPLCRTVTPYKDKGYIQFSSVSQIGGDYFFTSYNMSHFSLRLVHHLYRYSDTTLTEIKPYYLYLSRLEDMMQNIVVNDFLVTKEKQYVSLQHICATKDSMLLRVADSNFATIYSRTIRTNDYLDFNRMVMLPSGNILILMANTKQTWSYYLYDSRLNLVKEVQTALPARYHPYKLVTTDKGRVECYFGIDITKEKDCLVQVAQIE